MKIKIIKCSEEEFWYKHLIGTIHTVEKCNVVSNGDCYIRNHVVSQFGYYPVVQGDYEIIEGEN